MATFEQAEWGGGIYRGRRAPAGSVYDALNALVDDESNLFKRGATAYKSNADAGGAVVNIADAYFFAGRRTLFGSGDGLWTLDTDDQTPLALTFGPSWLAHRRLVSAAGAAFIPADYALSASMLIVYGGVRDGAWYDAGTASVATGSRTVTGVGTLWQSDPGAEPGKIFYSSSISSNGIGLIESVDSDTSLTLVAPWGDAPMSGDLYTIAQAVLWSPPAVLNYAGTANAQGIYMTTVGAVARLVMATKRRAYVSDPGNPFHLPENSYLEVPSDVEIIGADSLAGVVLLFTTRGVWAVGNLDFDAVDDAGNVQWQQEQVNKDLVLWGDAGIAAWEGVLVVPAVDDVYLFAPSGEARALSEAIRPMYRAYVKAGYQPGIANVHRGHYVLPILNGSTVVDVLVCRLDRPYGEAGMRPWTRWAGHAAGTAYAVRVGSATRSPKLWGISGQRVTDLTGCMDVTSGSGQDANATTPVFRVDANDDDLGPGIRPNTAEKVRFVYETTGGTPTVDVSYATGPEGSSYSAATLKRGGGASDGTDYSAWRVGRKAERIRFRFECASQVTSLILRRREVTVRQAAQN